VRRIKENRPDGLGRQPEDGAIQHGVSNKSHWRMARTPAMQQALSNG